MNKDKRFMPWHDVTVGSTPNIAELVEVQLENGRSLLALYTHQRWQVPSSGSVQIDQGTNEIKNVVKWRSFAEGIADRQKSKTMRNMYIPHSKV